MLADFLAGGHASLPADQLMTRDRGYYRTYFPKLKIVEPTKSAKAVNGLD